MHNVGAFRGQAGVQEGWYGDKEGSQGALHLLPVLHDYVVALCAWRQHICTDSSVNGEEGRGFLVSLPAAKTFVDEAGRFCKDAHCRCQLWAVQPFVEKVEGLALNLLCHKFNPIQEKIDNTMKVEMSLPDSFCARVS